MSTENGISSGHADGVNVCMMDGSVKFVDADTTTSVMLALGQMSDGEVVEQK